MALSLLGFVLALIQSIFEELESLQMLKDPGNPRHTTAKLATHQQAAQQGHSELFPTPLPFSLNGILRGGVLAVVSVTLLVSVYYAFEVFRQLGQFIQDPASARQAVADIGDMIAADGLTLQLSGEAPLQFGPLVAFCLLIFLYLVWLYVPATLITLSGRIILAIAKDLPDLKSKKALKKS